MHKIEVCNKVADKLFAAENAVDEAMVRASHLLEGIVEARRELNLSATSAELATARTAESIAALSEARRAVMAAHSALQNLQRKMGVEDGDIANAYIKPEQTEGRPTGLRANLRVAASQ